MQLCCVLRLLCMALVISLLMNQTKTLTSLETFLLEPWTLEPQNPGNLYRTLEAWNSWNLQPGNPGTLQNLGTLPDNIATLEPWNLLLGCKAGLIEIFRKSHQFTTIVIHHENSWYNMIYVYIYICIYGEYIEFIYRIIQYCHSQPKLPLILQCRSAQSPPGIWPPKAHLG